MEGKSKRSKKSGDILCWTTSMDEVLINAYLHQQTKGNKNGNALTSNALNIILEELKNHFPNKHISKVKMKDHMKHIH